MKSLWSRTIDWLRYGNTKIDDGIFLRFVDRDTSKYVEGDHAALVYIPILAGQPQVVIYKDSIKAWLPPHENEVMTAEDTSRILANICRFFDSGRVTYEIE